MARPVTRETLRDRIWQATDTERDPHISEAYLNDIISQEASELHGVLVQIDEDFFEKTNEFTAAGQEYYALPADWYKTKGVEREVTTDEWLPLERTTFRGRLAYQGSTGDACAYRHAGTRLYLYPRPTTGDYRIVYVPAAPELSDDEETVDGVNGFDDLIVWKCCVRVAIRKENPELEASFEKRYAEVLTRVTALASGPDLYENPVIADVESYGDTYPMRGVYARTPR